MGDIAIRIEEFRKEYPAAGRQEKRVAVQGLNLDVPAGGLFGFLGPNGAGKTTTIKMLLGFIPATSGNAWIFDKPVSDDTARRRVGYLPEQPYFPKFLTAQEVVSAHAGLAGKHGAQGRETADRIMKRVGVWDYRRMQLSKCSKGMVQRVGLATALVADPTLLILDEPSSGLDPVGRKELRDLLGEVQSEGVTVFLSSHLLSEMEYLCDRVGILCRGILVACGSPDEIVQTRDEVAVQIERSSFGAERKGRTLSHSGAESERDDVLDGQLKAIGATVEAMPEPGRSRVTVPSSLVYKSMQLFDTHRARLLSVAPRRESLEDAFLRLVG